MSKYFCLYCDPDENGGHQEACPKFGERKRASEKDRKDVEDSVREIFEEFFTNAGKKP